MGPSDMKTRQPRDLLDFSHRWRQERFTAEKFLNPYHAGSVKDHRLNWILTWNKVTEFIDFYLSPKKSATILTSAESLFFVEQISTN